MRIFLDSKDLINLVRRSEPFGVDAADAWLRERNAFIVLCHTSVSEFVPVATNDRLRVRWELQQLERLPTLYIRLGDLSRAELLHAVAAYAARAPAVAVEPFVEAFWQTFWEFDPSSGEDVAITRQLERRVGFRLDEQIDMLWTRPENFMNTQLTADSLQQILDRQRRRTPHERFTNDLVAASEDCETILGSDFEPFVKWLQETPRATPAWRLFWQASEELMLNREDVAKPGDVRDLTHVSVVPYVDAATLDGRFLSYTRQAAAKLRRIDASIDYEGRLFRSFDAIVKHYS
ncbi:MAG: hypothetical protein AABO58_17635 [Acidobacteriota bacterium]